jgi:hypothetical protein
MSYTPVVSEELFSFVPTEAQQFAHLRARKSFRPITFDRGCFKQMARYRIRLAAELGRHFIGN